MRNIIINDNYTPTTREYTKSQSTAQKEFNKSLRRGSLHAFSSYGFKLPLVGREDTIPSKIEGG
jgi:hypothetical protein